MSTVLYRLYSRCLSPRSAWRDDMHHGSRVDVVRPRSCICAQSRMTWWSRAATTTVFLDDVQAQVSLEYHVLTVCKSICKSSVSGDRVDAFVIRSDQSKLWQGVRYTVCVGSPTVYRYTSIMVDQAKLMFSCMGHARECPRTQLRCLVEYSYSPDSLLCLWWSSTLVCQH